MATDDEKGRSRDNKIPAWGLGVTVLAALFTLVQVGQGTSLLCDTPLGKDCTTEASPTVVPTHYPTFPTTEATRSPTTKPPHSPTSEPANGGGGQPQVKVVWRGTVLIRRAAGIDLDTTPPSQATGPAGNINSADVLPDNSRYGLEYRLTAMSSASIAAMSDGSAPNAYSCLEALQTVAEGDAPSSVGTTLCIGTGRGNVTMVKVAAERSDGLLLSVTQWN